MFYSFQQISNSPPWSDLSLGYFIFDSILNGIVFLFSHSDISLLVNEIQEISVC